MQKEFYTGGHIEVSLILIIKIIFKQVLGDMIHNIVVAKNSYIFI